MAAAILLECHTLVVREPGAAKNDLVAAALLLAAVAILVNAWTPPPRRPRDAESRADGAAEAAHRLPVGLAARGRRARGRAGGRDEGDGAGDGGGAERRRARAGARGAALGGRRLVVRAGAARRRLLVPAQPGRRRQPAAAGREPRADLAAAPGAAAGRPARLQHRPLRDRHRRLARLLRARPARGLRRALAAGRSAAPSSAALLALLRGRDRVVRWVGGVALFGLLAYLFTPLSAAGAEGAPVGFGINIRYVDPGPARRPGRCCRCRASSTAGGASGGCSALCSSSSCSPTAPTRVLRDPDRGSSRLLLVVLARARSRRRCCWRAARGASRGIVARRLRRPGARRGRDRLPGPAPLPRRPLRATRSPPRASPA